MAFLPEITGQDIAGQQSRDLAGVQRSVGVRPGSADENRLHMIRLPLVGGCKKARRLHDCCAGDGLLSRGTTPLRPILANRAFAGTAGD